MWPFSKPKPKFEEPKPNREDSKPDKYELDVKTGPGFLRSSRYGFDRKFKDQVYTGRHGTFVNISPSDRKFIQELIMKHARKLPVGAGFPRVIKLKMKEEVERARVAGDISLVDKKDFIKIIDNLPHG